MKNPKSQHPTSREIPRTNYQTKVTGRRITTARPWSLKFGAFLVLGISCLVLFPATSARAQSYSINWYKVAGGGGTSTGGTYSVSGTIGQHDAGGPMTGGN